MSAEVSRTRRVGRPPRLTLDAIVDAAERLLAAEGVDKMSMRRLATELSSTPMALYHHVRDKDALLVRVLESQARAMPRPELPDEPRERLVAASVLLYELLAERPWIVEVLTGDDLIGPSALWIVEVMVGAAADCGLDEEEAFFAYRTIWFYIVGDLIIRVTGARRRARTETVHQDEVVAGLTVETHPRLASLADRWSELNGRDTHRQALEAIIHGLLLPRS
ncbi:TetR/AcrR family transcriptional regulator [Actinoplanes subglobosus]|uniref:TetR/AcrR family transcriptional regulator n=1 Tax=Actinoplanes subglobosus TaxID=1547892 RepID=A0ABV8JB61_9ACTN